MADGEEAPAPYVADAMHLVRTATLSHLQLSQMADQKASILMGATFVVFTIAVGQASRGQFPVALSVLACFAFVSAFCAVAAIMPTIKPPPVEPGAENILFFGAFTRFSEEEFTARVLDRLHSEEDVYRTMLRDIYQNGQVLQRKKYRYLGLAYRVFLMGLTVTFLTFLLEGGAGLMGF